MVNNINNNELENRGWDDMKAILDREIPSKKRRFIPFYWYISTVAAGLAVILFYNTLKTINIYENSPEVKIEEEEINNIFGDQINTNKKEIASIDVNKVQISNTVIESDKVGKDYTAPNIKITERVKNEIPEGGSEKIGNDLVSVRHLKLYTEKMTNLNTPLLPSNPVKKVRSYINIPVVAVNSSDKRVSDKNEREIEEKSASKVDIVSGKSKDEYIDNIEIATDQNKIPAKKVLATENNLNLTTTRNDGNSEKIVDQNISKTEVTLSENKPTIDKHNQNIPETEAPNSNSLEEVPFEPIPNKSKSRFYAEAGVNLVFNKGFGYNYHLGLRYDVVHNKKLKILAGLSGLYSPTNIKYTITNYTVDANNRGKSENIENIITSIKGLNVGGFFQYQINKKGNFYLNLNPGISFISFNTAGSSPEMLLRPAISSKDATQSGAFVSASSNLKSEKINLYSSLGIGYLVSHFGLELYYRTSHNGLRNSGLANYQTQWLDQLGLNGIYRF